MQTCKNLIERAYLACDSGMIKAQSQCLGVMGELGRVYHHARDVLDRINPERWAAAARPPQPSPDHRLQPEPPPPPPPPPGRPVRRKRQLAPAGFADVDVAPPPHG